jgi:hypothetical protein
MKRKFYQRQLTMERSVYNADKNSITFRNAIVMYQRHTVFLLEICALLGYNAASSGSPLPTFRGNVSVPSSRVKNSKKSVLAFLRWLPICMSTLCSRLCLDLNFCKFALTVWVFETKRSWIRLFRHECLHVRYFDNIAIDIHNIDSDAF